MSDYPIITTHFSPQFDTARTAGNLLMWIASYRNSLKIVSQYDKNGNPRSFAEVPRENLKRVSIVDIISGRLIASQDFIQGMSPFYRQRSAIVQNVGVITKVHILGWAIWDGKPTVSNLHVSFINESTQSVEMGHFVEGRDVGFKYPIVLEDYDYPPIVWT